jgi:acetyltransferase EpsM
VVINTRASVDHHGRVGNYAHIAVAHLAGGASIDDGVFLALGSVVLPKVHVGAWATVGAGAVVTKDVAPKTTVVGVPARPLAPKAVKPCIPQFALVPDGTPPERQEAPLSEIP